MKTNIERKHLETALNMRAGYTLGIIDSLLVQTMARMLQEGCDKPVFAWHTVDARTGDAQFLTTLDDVNKAIETNVYLEVTPLFTERHAIQVSEAGIAKCKAILPTGDQYQWGIPPHIYRELVNDLLDTAEKYAGCQQLREQLSQTLQKVLVPSLSSTERLDTVMATRIL